MKKNFLVLSSIVVFLFLGCSEKSVIVKAKMPPKVNAFSNKRSIAVIPFKGDNINFTGRLEAKLASVRSNGKPYFNVVSRDKIGAVLKELKFQASDLVGKKAARFGKISGAKVLITGNVKTSAVDGSYKEPREVCAAFNKKGKCLYSKTVYITCRTSNATFNATINAIDVSTARVIDAVNISKHYEADSCKNKSIFDIFGNKKKFKTAQEALSDLADEAATEYVNRIAPHYVKLKIELIDKVKSVDLNSKEEKMFDNALAYIQDGRFDRAEYLLKKLNELTGENSYEIAYDLGVVEEALGKYKEALAAYKLADNIILKKNEEPSKLVDKAIERVSGIIRRRSK